MIAFILIWLLTLDACQTHAPPPQPITYEEEVVPKPYHAVTQPEDPPAPKNLSEKKRLELLEGQLDWMQKRIGNEKMEWNDR